MSLVDSGYYKSLTARQFWEQLNPWSLHHVEALLGDPNSAFFGQILADLLHSCSGLGRLSRARAVLYRCPSCRKA